MSLALADIADWDRARLIDAWHTLYGIAPPNRVRTDFLRRAIAWQAQAGWNGSGPAPRVTPSRQKTRRPIHGPGTRLIREWQGQTYQVLMTEDGCEWQGRRYRSLSALARQITGTRWSGPAFFGIRT